METRAETHLYLIGSTVTELLGAKLPSNRQVFGLFLRRHLTEGFTIRSAAMQVIKEVLNFWEKARIPVRQSQHCICKLEKMFYEWTVLKKDRNRETPLHKQTEAEFIENLENLFDVAHADALNIIKNSEDRAFLLAQREKGRRGVMGSVDHVLTAREQRACQAAEKEQKRRLKAEAYAAEMVSTSNVISSPSEDSTDDGTEEDDVGVSSPKKKKARRATKNIMTPELSAALDRTGVSSRQATFVLAETAKSLGYDIADINVNRMSIHRQRKQHRAQFVAELKRKFTADAPVVVHWDGKLMEELTSKQHVDRLPVIVTGEGISQLLGVPKIPSGTGEAQASAVKHLLEEWDLCDQVGALCFDTTAANTGNKAGACVLLEQKLQCNMLYLACRHHVMELLIGIAFEKVVGKSFGPEIQLFKRFREQWDFIDKESFHAAPSDDFVQSALADVRGETLEFAQYQLTESQPRDDYREFLELSIIFLGEAPLTGVNFKAPGAIHHARWMAKVLYVLKIWLFRKQFTLTAREESGVRDIAIFAAQVYLKAWITAPSAISAPLNDLQLMNTLLQYSAIHGAISSATTKKFSSHLWYLSQELVCLALFDKRVFSSTKRLMVAALQKVAAAKPPKRAEIDLSSFQSCTLDQLVTSNSMNLFHTLKLPTGFLSADPDTWELQESYSLARRRLETLKVVNDIAERAVALIQEYNKSLTKDEEDLQFLLHVIADHRQLYSTANKTELM